MVFSGLSPCPTSVPEAEPLTLELHRGPTSDRRYIEDRCLRYDDFGTVRRLFFPFTTVWAHSLLPPFQDLALLATYVDMNLNHQSGVRVLLLPLLSYSVVVSTLDRQSGHPGSIPSSCTSALLGKVFSWMLVD